MSTEEDWETVEAACRGQCSRPATRVVGALTRLRKRMEALEEVAEVARFWREVVRDPSALGKALDGLEDLES